MKPYDESKLTAICEFVKEYQVKEGRSPSYREIAKRVGRDNPGTIARYLKELQRRGLIDKDKDGTIAIDMKFFAGRTKSTSLVGAVACGTPILAQENIEGNFQLPVEIFGSAEHFMLRAQGFSMIEKGISDGDIIVVRRQNYAEPGQVVIALIDEDATAKIYLPKKDKVILRAANSSVDEKGRRCYPDIVTDHCELLGVVDNVIHRML